jgi:hypothetical protein
MLVSKIFYRYQQGDEYEEEFGGNARSGVVVARRSVRIRDGVLDRIEAPEGVFLAEPRGWRQVRRTRPRLSGGARSALRAYGEDQAGPRRLGTDLAGNRRRADKRLPEITGLIDPAQFELITRAGGYRRSAATRAGQDHRRCTDGLSPTMSRDRIARCSCVFSPALRGCRRHRAVARRGECGSSPTATGRTTSDAATAPTSGRCVDTPAPCSA